MKHFWMIECPKGHVWMTGCPKGHVPALSPVAVELYRRRDDAWACFLHHIDRVRTPAKWLGEKQALEAKGYRAVKVRLVKVENAKVAARVKELAAEAVKWEREVLR